MTEYRVLPAHLEFANSIANEVIREDADGYETASEREIDWILARDSALTAIEQLEAFRPMNEWDRRDETVLLLVDYRDGDHPLDDAQFAVTIGHNNDHNVGDGEGQGWQFAGWCWSHDHYVQGKGQPIGWLPLPHHVAAPLNALAEVGA